MADRDEEPGVEDEPAPRRTFAGAETIGIRALRGDLASRVRAAGAGRTTLVTVDGTAVAALCPVEAAAGEPTVARLAARGMIRPATRVERERPDFVMPTWAGVRLDRILRDVRGR
ncbi:MAG: hypothetical protein R2698_08115 [Microthrixaceae bacterium]